MVVDCCLSSDVIDEAVDEIGNESDEMADMAVNAEDVDVDDLDDIDEDESLSWSKSS